MTDQEFIFAPPTIKVDFKLSPVDSIMNSLWLLDQADNTSGLGEWVKRTYEAMTPEQLHRHRVVFHVFLAGYECEDTATSFPEYLDRIASRDPYQAQQQIIEMFENKCESSEFAEPIPRDVLLGNKEAFLEMVQSSIGKHYAEKGIEIDLSIYADGHDVLPEPEVMHRMVVEHMRFMWETHLREEWYRNLPMLEESIAAFKQLDFNGMTSSEVVRNVTRRDLTAFWPDLETAEQIVFVPSAHIGPYNSYYKKDGAAYLVFGARMPAGARTASTALSRSELLVHLNALADDTRLTILELLTHHDELCAQDIINMLQLSQSSASRHLRQLTATGYLTERRRDIAKCYSLNTSRVEDTTSSLRHFLGNR